MSNLTLFAASEVGGVGTLVLIAVIVGLVLMAVFGGDPKKPSNEIRPRLEELDQR